MQALSLLSQHFSLSQLVVQPTPFCNLRCTYCYIPEVQRALAEKMNLQISRRIASDLIEIERTIPDLLTPQIQILWHAGEPTSIGINGFKALAEPFEEMRIGGRIRHAIQTNATMINPKWCEVFAEYDVLVGVSIDGPERYNLNRVDGKGRPMFKSIMHGISFLKERGIPFGAIAVVSVDQLSSEAKIEEYVTLLYQFFSELGCGMVGFNFEERENYNESREVPDDERVNLFWNHMYKLWEKDRSFEIRELQRVETWLQRLYNEELHVSYFSAPVKHNLIPTVDHRGNVCVLAPELLGTSAPEYQNFIVGNLLEDSLMNILMNAMDSKYVLEFLEGVEKCQTCPFFSGCHAGSTAANKFFENKDFRSTETAYCRNLFIRPAQTVISAWTS